MANVKPAEDTDNTILQPDPKGKTLLDVQRVTMAVNDWSDLAPLIGVLQADYDRLVAQESDIKKLKKAIISQWLNNGIATWAILAAGLRDPLVGKVAVGDEIAKKYPRASPSSDGATPAAEPTPSTGSLPTIEQMLDVLSEKSARWNEIGGGLHVSFDFREGLRAESLSNQIRLEKVFREWIQSQTSPVTWERFKQELVKMKLMDCAAKVGRIIGTN